MLKHEEDDIDLENKKTLFNLHCIENVNHISDEDRPYKKEVFNDKPKMNQGFIDLISAYCYVENKVLNKNK
jgi:hypothetical protein